MPSLSFELTKTPVPLEEVAPNIFPIWQLLSTLLPSAPIQMRWLAVVMPPLAALNTVAS